MNSLEQKIEYSFKNRDYLEEALTHSSYANENSGSMPCNERMEFLGDAVLSIISAKYLFNKFPQMPEGRLTKLRSSLVCTQSLSQFAKEIDLGSYLKMGKGERASGGSERPSVLEDAFESLIAAIYLDGGMEEAERFVLRFLSREVENHHSNFHDYKSLLQEIIQQNPDETLTYTVVGTSGPDHDKRFDVELKLNSNIIGRGHGTSKKNAEQLAAKEALELMGVEI
ncbi:MAG: ribonuclease III [Ruminococcaceae bacterium]|nr:ribonuclease III [Oscillospiraceae bacterium]